MKGTITNSNGRWVVSYTKKQRGGTSIAPYSYVKIECESRVMARQYHLCEEGKVVLFEFFGTKSDPFALIVDEPIDLRISKAIKKWLSKGDSKPETITKEIISMLKKDNTLFVTQTKAMKALKHVRNEYEDEDKVGTLTDKMLKNCLKMY